jgi:hypothetical protein
MNLPEKFTVVNVNTGIQCECTVATPLKIHAKWKNAKGNEIETFIDREIFENDIENAKMHIVDRSLPCPGMALRSRTSAEFLDFMMKTTRGLTKEVCNSIAQTVLVINKAAYGPKPT